MTFIPKQLQEAFRFTDKILRKREVFKAMNSNAGTLDFESSTVIKEITSATVELVNKNSSRKLKLDGFVSVDDLWKHHSHELKLQYPRKTEAQIKKILSEIGAAHFSNFSGSADENAGYILMNDSMKGNTLIEDLDTKMNLLHELTHAVDNHNFSNMSKQAIYMKEGQNLKRLNATDLQKALNMIYIEEHAHGQSIRVLKKTIKKLPEGDDKYEASLVLKRHLDALKEYTDHKKVVIQELKRRQGKGSAVSDNRSIPDILKWIAGGLGLAGLGALGWHWFKPKPSQTATSPEAMPSTSTKQA